MLLSNFIPAVSTKQIKVFHPSIQVGRFLSSASRTTLREKYNIPAGAFVLISVGRLTKRKNQMQVLRALKQLQGNEVNIFYIVVGDGPERESLEHFAAEHKIENVEFMTNSNDAQKTELLALSDIFVLPTIKIDHDLEGFGIALLEAQAAGRSVICGNSGGEREAVLDQQSGFVIDGGDLGQLVEAIKLLKGDAALFEKMSKRAMTFSQSFDSAAIIPEIYKCCQALYE